MIVSILCLLAASSGYAQISTSGGNQTMTITTGMAGGQPANVINTSTTLRYKSQAVIAKITVSTSCPGQKFGLSVLATSVTQGVAAPEVTLLNGNPSTDMVTDIPAGFHGNASCTLQFTASANFSDGNSTELGNDLHTITYTIQAQ